AGPGGGEGGSRSSGTPCSAAATAPRLGRPTTPTHPPVLIAPASSASSRDIPPVAATVAPRRSPPDQGSSGANSGCTGRCPAAPTAPSARSPPPATGRSSAAVFARRAPPALTAASTRATSSGPAIRPAPDQGT